MNIEVICPLYNSEKYILNLNKSILKQKNVNICKITYLLTESNDNSLKILKDNKLNYHLIKKKDFSHSLTREKYALKSKSDIVVFISQDILIEKDNWLHELVKPIINNECDASFSRQICKDNTIEKYIREKNYPNIDRIVSKNDIDRLQINTFFFSDASSAVKTSTFKKINGYDNKNLPTSEDMYLAYKLIMNNYKIKYISTSEIFHSHNFSFKELFNRYKLIGKFFKENSYLNNYKTTDSGFKLAIYVFKRILKDKNIKALFNFIPNMTARYIGMKVGMYGK